MKKILNQLHSHILLVCYPHTLCPYLFIAAPHPPPLSPTCTYCALSTLLGLRCTVLHYSASPRLTSFFHTLSTIQLHTTPLSTSPSLSLYLSRTTIHTLSILLYLCLSITTRSLLESTLDPPRIVIASHSDFFFFFKLQPKILAGSKPHYIGSF